MNQALKGMKVLDLSQLLAGPYCTMVLGDMGADVIKLEKVPKGDDMRSVGPYEDEESYLFMMVNRNKRSLKINLKTEEGKKAFDKLLQTADVVIENYRPGVAKKLNVDYERLKTLKPDLIYCSISGYGQTGPYRDKGGYDIMAQGMSGVMAMTGEKGGKPVKVGIALHDIAAAQTAIQSILTSYIHKLKTKEGQYIDISLVDSGLAWTVWEAAGYFGAGEVPARNGTAHRASTPYQGYTTADGYILIGAANQRLWERLCQNVLLKPEWIDDPHYVTNNERIENVDILEKDIEQVLKEKPSDYWLALLEKEKIPCGPIYTYDQTMNDPHIHARDMVLEYEHPTAGLIQTLGFPAKYSKTPGQIRRHAPALGEHNEEILRELGYSESEIQQLSEFASVST